MRNGGLSIPDVLGRQTVHPFPARMAPCLAYEILSNLPSTATVLDPMSGSGTVLAIARMCGHKTVGFDLDPLAVLISRVWTRSLDFADLRNAAAKVFQRAVHFARKMDTCDAYPDGADVETRRFTRYWFDRDVRRQLASLSTAIAEIDDVRVREALWCAFSRLIVAKQAGVSLALDLTHSRPHKVFRKGPRRPFELFLSAIERVIDGCISNRAGDRGPASRIGSGDVRRMPVASRSVDLVFTSPPYLNAIDYLRCSKFSLVWMGYSIPRLREIRAHSIGTETGADQNPLQDEVLQHVHLRPSLAPRMEHILRKYIDDTHGALKEISRVLVRSGRAIYVVGENTIRGTYIPTSRIVSALGECLGLRVESTLVRDLPSNRRYLPPPGGGQSALDGRMRREVILTFAK